MTATLTALIVFCVALTSASAAIGLDADIWQELKYFRSNNRTPEQRAALLVALDRVPNWEDRLAKRMAELALEARYDGESERIAWHELQPLQRRVESGALTPEEAERRRNAVERMRAETPIVIKVKEARRELNLIQDALSGLGDERAVRFLAPLLAEQSAPINYFTDSISEPVQNVAAGRLGVLALRARLAGTPLPDDPNGKDRYALKTWRKWWAANRHRYEPLPEALAALEATRGGLPEGAEPANPLEPRPGAAPDPRFATIEGVGRRAAASVAGDPASAAVSIAPETIAPAGTLPSRAHFYRALWTFGSVTLVVGIVCGWLFWRRTRMKRQETRSAGRACF